MKRNESVTQDTVEIFEMLEHCTTINLGMKDEPYPYVIPMTFGCAVEDEKIAVYCTSG